MKAIKKIKCIEYWFDGMTSSYQVSKSDYYNSYFEGIHKFKRIIFEDMSEIYINN